MSEPDEPAGSATATVSARSSDDEGHVVTPPAEGSAGRDVAAGDRVGRYVIEHLLGAGGMGAVFAAHDPTLARTVALKVIRGRHADRGRQVREAQAIARVAHANVVQVFDAGVDAQGRVFIAMERVEGETLAEWLAGAPRDVEAIVERFRGAGRGLAAAHAAGLVHRDFKPANVIVGKDGVPRVVDFGVAQADDEHGDGAVVGTPHYMSPEQWTGAPVDARSDQFSFCVALFRALGGELPFDEQPGGGRPAGWRRRPWPRPVAGRVVPARVRAAIDRGLATDPAARFPSMDGLLAALADPLGRRRRRRWIAAVGVVAVGVGSAVAAAALVGRAPGAAPRDPCAAPGDRFAGVWDGPARDAVQAAFTRTGVDYAATAFREVAAILDRRRASWEAARRQSCEATRVQGVQSDAALDLRAACLERRAHEVDALVGLLRTADATMVSHAVSAADATGDVSVCDDASVLARRAPPPTDPAARAAIGEVERALAVARAQLEAGQPEPVQAAATELVERATRLGYAPLIAEAQYLRGDVALDLADREVALAAYERGSLAAEEGGDDRLRFDVELRLVAIEGQFFEREAPCRQHLERAAALHARLGADAVREARLLSHRGHADLWFGHNAEARTHLAAAAAVLDGRPGDRLLQSRILYRLGTAYIEARDPRRAADAFERALAIQLELLGDAHPTVARTLTNRADVLVELGRSDRGADDIRRARAIYVRAFGPRAAQVADADVNLAGLLMARGELPPAIAAARSAISIYEEAYGPGNSKVGWARHILGAALSKSGQRAEAEQELARALAIVTRVGGPKGMQAIAVRDQQARHLRRGGALRRARDQWIANLRDLETTTGPTSTALIAPLMDLGQTEAALGDHPAALAAYERAWAIEAATPRGPLDHAQLALGLATSLHALARDPARVRALATEARDGFAAAGVGSADELAQAEALLRQLR